MTGGIYDTQCEFKVFRGDVADSLFRQSSIDGFAIDVELIYLLLKYRLDIKRIPVQLIDNGTSSVHVLRDSMRAARDIAAIRINWAAGRYRSPELEAILRDDYRADLISVAPPVTVETRATISGRRREAVFLTSRGSWPATGSAAIPGGARGAPQHGDPASPRRARAGTSGRRERLNTLEAQILSSPVSDGRSK